MKVLSSPYPLSVMDTNALNSPHTSPDMHTNATISAAGNETISHHIVNMDDFTPLESTSRVLRNVLGALTCIIIVISITGNTFVLLAVSKTKSLQKLNNAWYVSLAAADLGRATLCMPIFAILIFKSRVSLDPEFCAIYHSFHLSLQTVSIFNLTAISIDRVFIITRPLVYQRVVTKRRMGAGITGIWLVSFTYGFLQLLWWVYPSEPESFSADMPILVSEHDCRFNPSLGFSIFDMILTFAIPLTIMTVAYVKIYHIVRHQMKRLKRRVSVVWEDWDTSESLKTQAPTQKPKATQGQYSHFTATDHRTSLPESSLEYTVEQPDRGQQEMVDSANMDALQSGQPDSKEADAAGVNADSNQGRKSSKHVNDTKTADVNIQGEDAEEPVKKLSCKSDDTKLKSQKVQQNALQNETKNCEYSQAKTKARDHEIKHIQESQKRAPNKTPNEENTNNNARTHDGKTDSATDEASTNQRNTKPPKPQVSQHKKFKKHKPEMSKQAPLKSQSEKLSKNGPKLHVPQRHPTPTITISKPASPVKLQSSSTTSVKQPESPNIPNHGTVHRSRSNSLPEIPPSSLPILKPLQNPEQLCGKGTNPTSRDKRNSISSASKIILHEKRPSVQFQLYSSDTEAEEDIHKLRPPKVSKKAKKPKVVQPDDETLNSSEVVTIETFLSSSTSQNSGKKSHPSRSRVLDHTSQRHTQVWASRHFSADNNFSYTSGTPRPSITESVGSMSSWSTRLQRKKKSLRKFRENKAVKMMAVVVGAFVVCWLPYEVLFVVKQACVTCISDGAWIGVNTLAYSASAINPFIYNFYSSEFRRALRRALCCRDNQVGSMM